jgi:hypothetical protein
VLICENPLLVPCDTETAKRCRYSSFRFQSYRPLSPEESDGLSWMTRLDGTYNLRYRGWIARCLDQPLQLSAVREAVKILLELLAQLGMQRQRLEQTRQREEANWQA